MFKVGGKYLYYGDVYECLAVDGKNGWLRQPSGRPATFTHNDQWIEYHEPVVVKSKKVVCFQPDHSASDRSIYTMSKDYITRSDNVVGEIELTVTDGKLTDVKIL